MTIGARNPMVWGSIPHGESRIFSLSNARERMKNIFLYFFTEPKTYPSSYSIGKTCWKIATGNNRVYLHITFGGIFTIHQGLISCPLHGKTALKISNITFWNSQKIIGSDRSKTVIFKTTLVYAWLIFSLRSHPRILWSKSGVYQLYHNNDCERSLNWTICSTAPTSPLSWIP